MQIDWKGIMMLVDDVNIDIVVVQLCDVYVDMMEWLIILFIDCVDKIFQFCCCIWGMFFFNCI